LPAPAFSAGLPRGDALYEQPAFQILMEQCGYGRAVEKYRIDSGLSAILECEQLPGGREVRVNRLADTNFRSAWSI
jgi:hypothetical protein